MGSKKQKNFVVITGLSTHTTNSQDVSVRYLNYRKLKSWAYVTHNIHPTTIIAEVVRQLNEKTDCTITEIVEPAATAVRMLHAV